VTLPCQKRFVEYFTNCVTERKLQFPKVDRSILLEKITLYTTPHFDLDKGCDPYFFIQNYKCKPLANCAEKEKIMQLQMEYDSRTLFPVNHHVGTEVIEFDNVNIELRGSFKLHFYDYDQIGSDDSMFYTWFHTSFMQDAGTLVLDKYKLDGAHKDKKHKNFDEAFRIEIQYKVLEEAKYIRVKKSLIDSSVAGTVERKQAEKSQKTHTYNSSKHYHKATELVVKKQYKKAIPIFTKAIESISVISDETDEVSADILLRSYYYRGLCHYNSNKIEDAVTDLNNAVKQYELFVKKSDENYGLAEPVLRARILLGTVYAIQQKVKKAVVEFNEAVDLASEMFDLSCCTVSTLIEAYSAKAHFLENTSDWRRAHDVYSQLVDIVQSYQSDTEHTPSSHKLLSDSLCKIFQSRALALMKLSLFSQAFDDFSRCLEVYAEIEDKDQFDPVDVNVQQARCLILCKKESDAFKTINSILKTNAKHADANYYLAVARMELLGDLEQALFQINKTLQINNNHYLARYTKGVILLKKQDLAAATKEFQEALKIRCNNFPRCAVAFARLIVQEKQNKKYPDAEKLYANAITTSRGMNSELPDDICLTNSEFPLVIGELGTLYRKMSKPGHAIRTLTEALTLSPSNVSLLFELGNAHVDHADLDQAEKCFQQILKIDKSHKGAKNALEELFE
jgi:tetratricopeptide (TPR) repeat protein